MTSYLAQHRVVIMLAGLLLIGALVAQVAGGRRTSGPSLSSHSSEAEGALALAMWVERMGIPVARAESAAFSLESTDLLFVLLPIRNFEGAEARALVDWVNRGGRLVYVPTPDPTRAATFTPELSPLDEELELQVRFRPRIESGEPARPAFVAPSARRFELDTNWALDLRGDSWEPMIQDGDRVVAASRVIGRGRVYAATSTSLFSNQGIRKEDNPAFVLNILARDQPRNVAFEEYHHSLLAAPTLATVARASPWGWALGYAALASFLLIIWGGRRFGPALVSHTTPRRSSGEYIGALAGLLQRARAIDWAQQQYAGLLRRRLTRALGVRADMPADELARVWAERQHSNGDQLSERLRAIEGRTMGDRALLLQARAIEQLLASAERSRP